MRYVFDKHDPVQNRIFTARPNNLWNYGDIFEAERDTRRLERRRKRMITAAKETFLNTKMAELTGNRSLFKISLLLKKPGTRLPAHDDLATLMQRFRDFFIDKVRKIRTSLQSAATNPATKLPVTSCIFNAFSPVTVGQLVSIITSSPTDSCPLDPIPTFLFKKLVHLLSIPISKIANPSLTRGLFPNEKKLVLVTPLLKKSRLSLTL